MDWEYIFEDDEIRDSFLKVLYEVCDKNLTYDEIGSYLHGIGIGLQSEDKIQLFTDQNPCSFVQEIEHSDGISRWFRFYYVYDNEIKKYNIYDIDII